MLLPWSGPQFTAFACCISPTSLSCCKSPQINRRCTFVFASTLSCPASLFISPPSAHLILCSHHHDKPSAKHLPFPVRINVKLEAELRQQAQLIQKLLASSHADIRTARKLVMLLTSMQVWPKRWSSWNLSCASKRS